jgi:hypothetical protein
MQDPHIRGSDSARLEDLQFLGEQVDDYNFCHQRYPIPAENKARV